MVNKCCVPRCSGNYNWNNKVHTFKFPRDDDMRRKWLSAIKRDGFIPTKYSVVCHRHFTESDIRRCTKYYDKARNRTLTVRLDKPRLQEDAIPSVFACWYNTGTTKYNVKETAHGHALYLSDHTYARPCPSKSKTNYEDVADSSPSWTAERHQLVAKGPNEKVSHCGSPAVPSCFAEFEFGDKVIELFGLDNVSADANSLKEFGDKVIELLGLTNVSADTNGAKVSTFQNDHESAQIIIKEEIDCDTDNGSVNDLDSPHFADEDNSVSAACKSKVTRGTSCLLRAHQSAGPPQSRSPSCSQYHCAVFRCVTNARKMPGVVCHSFPKDEHLRREWIARCRRPDVINVRTARVCSVHFRPEDYVRDLRNELLGLPLRKKLVPTAIPSLNIPRWDEGEIVECRDMRKKRGGRRRKKLRRCDYDDSDNNNVDAVAHKIPVNHQDVIVKDEIIVKREVESDSEDVVDTGRQQDFEYLSVREEPLEDPDESTLSANEESCEQVGHDQELPVIIKEEIDCDDYTDPLSFSEETCW
ncbi:uncharacterized protein LOC124720074 [Schistocerca piceifrons]|uniref:uncharacterized protein LOC124720074 n=1 Tax=Schistocerca piceifrons TaxID=274613 RepID=UPI001F5E9019|nr:uncharacterized protein LOC124720074 [Schistocerca piceifrons]